MTTPIPGALKSADITRFAARAKQLEKADPVVSYWCDYMIVNRILRKGLHTEDEECMAYTTSMMDKLEAVKQNQPTNDAIHDDMAAQAYVEQFAQRVFQRGDNAMRTNKSNAATADTLQAASTFLELLAIWQASNPDPEVAQKIKYAKVHALRIAKALKAGEDPNLTNPVDETQIQQEAPALDPNDPEVQRIQSLQPTVEEDYDMQGVSPLPAATAASITGAVGDVSPLDAPPQTSEYFPQMPPTFTAASQPSIPVVDSSIAPAHIPTPHVQDPAQYYGAPSSSSIAPPQVPLATSRPPSHPQMLNQPSAPPQQISAPSFAAQATAPSAFAPPAAVQHASINAGQLRRDDESMTKASRHAKFAISALNFDDVDTAVKELRNALATLGAA